MFNVMMSKVVEGLSVGCCRWCKICCLNVCWDMAGGKMFVLGLWQVVTCLLLACGRCWNVCFAQIFP